MFFRKIVVAVLGQGIGLLYEFLIMVFAGRLLGADDYGKVLYVYTLLSICMIITKFGFEGCIVSYVARNDIGPEKKRWIVLLCLGVSLAVSICMIILIHVLKPFMIVLMGAGSDNYDVLRTMSPIIVLETMGILLSSVIKGRKETFRYYVVYMHMQYGIRLMSFIILWYLFGIRNIFSLIISYYLSCFSMILVAFIFLRETHIISGIKEKESLHSVFMISIPLMLSSAITVLNSQIDQYMIGYYLNNAVLAIYSMALNIGRVSSFALIAVNSIFAPTISECYYSGMKERLKNLYIKTTKWVTCFNMLILGVFSICSRDIMMLVGEEYSSGATVIIIILLGEVVNSSVGAVGYLNSMTGKAVNVFASNLIAVVMNIILNMYLIPSYGIAGAAIASAISVITCNLLLFYFMYRHLKMIPFTRNYVGIIVAFLGAFLLTISIHNFCVLSGVYIIVVCSLVFCFVFGVIAYFLIIESDERQYIKRLISGGAK
ncbi:oligosaccharide flippase family protein [Butyrivibrio sp. CB08]|uniref:oligosaccharide flippase family protein n=1 Tax=Butyrivibrio sp. CB08 TaxID=2364879 RepID=UPI001313D9BB|nr:oligosaccharide flippase family protein [Butyrivibrio sp. CB08]